MYVKLKVILIMCLLMLITEPAVSLDTAFTYQGELQQAGTAVTDNCDFSFGLWDAAFAGEEVAVAALLPNVPVNDGGFIVKLDFGTGVFTGEDRWLEIAVACPAGSGAPVTLVPRQQLTPAPNALYSVSSGTVDWSGLNNVPAGLDDGDDVDDADADASNELQDLELDLNTLILSDDATPVDLSGYLDNTDDQTLSEVLAGGNDAGNTTITNLPAPTVGADAATKAYVDAHADSDSDSTNELQNLSLNDNNLSLSGDASPVDLSRYLDACSLSACNEEGFYTLTCGAVSANIGCPAANWTARSAAEANLWTSVTYGEGLFIAVSTDGTNRVMTSPDGIAWTARAAAEANSWWSVAFGDGQFVAVAIGSYQVMTSPDGITWTTRDVSYPNEWRSVTYGGGQFVAVASDGAGLGVMTSPDGIIWTDWSASEANQWWSVTYGGGQFVAVSTDGTNRVMTSPDGFTWTARAAAEANQWRSVTYGGGQFVAVASSGTNRVMTSPDGITWTTRTAAEASSWQSITYGDGQFVAVSTSGTNRVMTSLDGITWTARSAAGSNTWYAVTHGGGQFVAVSIDGTNQVMTSPGL